jgi:hypothetical protein
MMTVSSDASTFRVTASSALVSAISLVRSIDSDHVASPPSESAPGAGHHNPIANITAASPHTL